MLLHPHAAAAPTSFTGWVSRNAGLWQTLGSLFATSPSLSGQVANEQWQQICRLASARHTLASKGLAAVAATWPSAAPGGAAAAVARWDCVAVLLWQGAVSPSPCWPVAAVRGQLTAATVLLTRLAAVCEPTALSAAAAWAQRLAQLAMLQGSNGSSSALAVQIEAISAAMCALLAVLGSELQDSRSQTFSAAAAQAAVALSQLLPGLEASCGLRCAALVVDFLQERVDAEQLASGPRGVALAPVLLGTAEAATRLAALLAGTPGAWKPALLSGPRGPALSALPARLASMAAALLGLTAQCCSSGSGEDAPAPEAPAVGARHAAFSAAKLALVLARLPPDQRAALSLADGGGIERLACMLLREAFVCASACQEAGATALGPDGQQRCVGPCVHFFSLTLLRA